MNNSSATSKGITAQVKLDHGDFCLDVDLQLPDTGISILFGHSGSGKTTLLRAIAGLNKADSGRIQFRDQIWQSSTTFVPTHERPIGYVFQEASLFSHLTAKQNLDYAIKRAPKTKTPIAFDQAVELLGISDLLKRRPAQLSGGERQRVAIARALLIQPQLLLMDEPLAALDLPRKLEILPYLENLKHELKLPIIYVTHSTDEVARLADFLVAMEKGQAKGSGSLSEIFSQLDFPLKLGEEAGVVLNGKVLERDNQWKLTHIAFAGGELWLRDNGHSTGSEVRVRVLARDISLAKHPVTDSSIVNTLPATIVEIAEGEHEGLALVKLQVGNSFLVARVTQKSVHELQLNINQPIWAQVKSVAII